MQSTRSSAGCRNAIRERRVEGAHSPRSESWSGSSIAPSTPWTRYSSRALSPLRESSSTSIPTSSAAAAAARVTNSASPWRLPPWPDRCPAPTHGPTSTRCSPTYRRAMDYEPVRPAHSRNSVTRCRRLRTQSLSREESSSTSRRATQHGERRRGPRLSFVTEGGKLTASAITDTATVPERLIGVDLALVGQAAARMTKPRTEDLASMASFMGQLVVPHDFRPLLRG